MAFQIPAPLKLLGYDADGKPDFGLRRFAPAPEAHAKTSAAAPSAAATAPVASTSGAKYKNKFAAACHLCGTWVEAEKGERFTVDRKWMTRHLPGDCPTTSTTATAVAPAAQAVNRPIVAGNGEPWTGYFTAQFGDDTKDYVTLRIRRQGKDSNFRPGQLIISYLMGRNNQSDYTRFAHVDERGRCWIWKSYAENARLRQAVASVLGDQKAAGEAWARASKCCWRCALPLTTPESLDRLMGEECYAKME
jgi:hypothetical protein